MNVTYKPAQEKVCVIVPAKGSADKIDKCVESILNTGCQHPDIIIVDDGIDTSALGKLGRFTNKIMVLKNDSCGPSHARNMAAQNTDAEFIAFTDSDCVVDGNWLNELMMGFRKFPEIAACGGAQRIPEDASPFEKSVFLFMKKCGFICDYTRAERDSIIREVNHNPSCNVMYRREIFLREKGFLEELWPGEDVEFDYRLKKKGYKLVFNPKAIIYHYRPKSMKGFWRMMYRYGFAQGFLVKKYGIFRKIHYMPILLIIVTALLFFGIFLGINFYRLSLSALAAGFLLAFIYLGCTLNVFALFLLTAAAWHLGFFYGILGGARKSNGKSKILVLAVNPMDDAYGSTHRFRKLTGSIAQCDNFLVEYIEPNSRLQGIKTFRQKNNFAGLLLGTCFRAYYAFFRKYDILLVQTLTPLTLAPILIALLKNKKIVIDWDDLSWMLQRGFLRKHLVKFCEHNFLRLADLVSVPNRYLAEYGRGLGAKGIFYISHGIDSELFNPGRYDSNFLRKNLAIPQENLILGYLASFTTGGVGDLDFIFLTVKEVLKRHPEVSFAVIGGGPLFKEYFSLAKRMNIANIYFTGWLPHARVPLYLAGIDIGLIYMRENLSNKYKTSLKVAEYLAMHKPVVGHLSGETRDNFRHFCLLSEPNQDSFAQRIEEAMVMPAPIDWEEVSAFLKNNYSWEKSAAVLKDAMLML